MGKEHRDGGRKGTGGQRKRERNRHRGEGRVWGERHEAPREAEKVVPPEEKEGGDAGGRQKQDK